MSESSDVVITGETTRLQNLWDDREAARLEAQPLELLRYRSNLLGADLRITKFGGGSRNRLLNQFTADATGRPVLAGPIEATALGNIAMQMLATGAVSSLGEARAVIARSFPVERFEPSEPDLWNKHYRRFHEYVELTCV